MEKSSLSKFLRLLNEMLGLIGVIIVSEEERLMQKFDYAPSSVHHQRVHEILFHVEHKPKSACRPANTNLLRLMR